MQQPDPMARIVEGIKDLGPRNISKLARFAHVPIETVRYKVKRMAEKGFRIHAHVDYGKLGLQRIMVKMTFTHRYQPMALPILQALSKIGYLILYNLIIPSGDCLTIIAVPYGKRKQYYDFLEHLVSIGILKSYDADEISYSTYLSMRQEYYNFDANIWDVDWSALEHVKTFVEPKIDRVEENPRVDKIDLLLLKELQIDSLQHLTSIADKLKIGQKIVRYHFTAHVEGRKLVKRYLVRWTGDLESVKRHEIFYLRAWFTDLTPNELMTAQETIHRLPFTWADMYCESKKRYHAEIDVPAREFIDTLQYLSRNISSFGEKFSYALMDPASSYTYVIPYQMFDQEDGWQFDLEDTKHRFTNLVESASKAMGTK